MPRRSSWSLSVSSSCESDSFSDSQTQSQDTDYEHSESTSSQSQEAVAGYECTDSTSSQSQDPNCEHSDSTDSQSQDTDYEHSESTSSQSQEAVAGYERTDSTSSQSQGNESTSSQPRVRDEHNIGRGPFSWNAAWHDKLTSATKDLEDLAGRDFETLENAQETFPEWVSHEKPNQSVLHTDPDEALTRMEPVFDLAQDTEDLISISGDLNNVEEDHLKRPDWEFTTERHQELLSETDEVKELEECKEIMHPTIHNSREQPGELKAFAVGLGNCQAAKYTVKIGRIDCKVVVMYDCGSTNKKIIDMNNKKELKDLGYMNDVKAFLEGTTYTFLILSHPDADHYNQVANLFSSYDGRLFTFLCGKFGEKPIDDNNLKHAINFIKEKNTNRRYREMYLNDSFKGGTLFEAMKAFQDGDDLFDAFKTAAEQIGPKVNFLAVNRAAIKDTKTDKKQQNKASPIISLTVANSNHTYHSLVCTGDAEEVSLGDVSSLNKLYSDNIEEVHSQTAFPYLFTLMRGSEEDQSNQYWHLKILTSTCRSTFNKSSHYTALMAPHHGSDGQRDVCKELIKQLEPKHVLVCGGKGGDSKALPHFVFLQENGEKLASTTSVHGLFVVNYFAEKSVEGKTKRIEASDSFFGIIDVNTYGTATIAVGKLVCPNFPLPVCWNEGPSTLSSELIDIDL